MLLRLSSILVYMHYMVLLRLEALLVFIHNIRKSNTSQKTETSKKIKQHIISNKKKLLFT